MSAEYWVMRVMLHSAPTSQLALLTLPERAELQVAIDRGALAMLPDNSIAEPVEVFDNENAAHLHREILRAKNPGEDFRVVLNSDVLL